VSGDLHIIGPIDLIPNVFFIHLKTVTHIRGSFIITEAFNLPSLSAFTNLKSVDCIKIYNMANLVDARMWSLTSLPLGAVVEGCPRLCPSRYPTTLSAQSPSSQDCANLNLNYFVNVVGDVSTEDLLVLEHLTSRWLFHLTLNKVWLSFLFAHVV
jgi:hypothetical protein